MLTLNNSNNIVATRYNHNTNNNQLMTSEFYQQNQKELITYV